ncbi:hypothetical protein Tco_0845630 [Tanacetum coccineum]
MLDNTCNWMGSATIADYADDVLRARDRYHNLNDDDVMKNIFNSGRYKDKVGMKIPNWMITEEMKLTEHYQMYAEVFGLDVPLTQSESTESTQGADRTPNAPRRSTRLTPPALVPTIDEADDMILQDTLQVSLVELEPKSDKESLEVEITNSGKSNDINNEEVEIINVVIHVNVNEEEVEITDEVYELKKREKGKIIEEFRSTPFPSRIRSLRIHTNLIYLDTEKLQELTAIDSTSTPSSSLPITNYKDDMGIFFEHLRAKFLSRKLFNTLTHHLQEVMVESLPIMVDEHVKEQVKKQVPEQVRDQVPMYVAEGLILERKRIKNRWLR